MPAPERLRRRADFLAADRGVRVVMPAFILLVRPTGGDARVGFTVSRKIGNAVARNRARRRLREMARATLPDAGVPAADHVFIARPQAMELPFVALIADGTRALAKAGRKLAGSPAGERA